jgi:hypothetical protein
MLERKDIDTTKLVVFGRSLGGAVAVHLAKAAPEKVRGVLREFRALFWGCLYVLNYHFRLPGLYWRTRS